MRFDTSYSCPILSEPAHVIITRLTNETFSSKETGFAQIRSRNHESSRRRFPVLSGQWDISNLDFLVHVH